MPVLSTTEKELLEALIAARDVLAALVVQCGYLPTFNAYSTKFTEQENQACQAVQDLDIIIHRYNEKP